MGRCHSAGSGSLGEVRRGPDVGQRRGAPSWQWRDSWSGRPAGGWALAALPPPLQHCPLGAREGKPPTGEGPGGAGRALTDGRAVLWCGARGAGTGGGGAGRSPGGAGAAQGLAKVTAACRNDKPTKSLASAAREVLSSLGPGSLGTCWLRSTRVRRGFSELSASLPEKRGLSRVKCSVLLRDSACGRRCTDGRARAFLPADPQIKPNQVLISLSLPLRFCPP